MDHQILNEKTQYMPKKDISVNQNEAKVHPQPTSDALDPLNWSRLQKSFILGIVMLKWVHPSFMSCKDMFHIPTTMKIFPFYIHNNNNRPILPRNSIPVRHQLRPGKLDRRRSRSGAIGRTARLVFSCWDIRSSHCVYSGYSNCAGLDYWSCSGGSVWGVYGCTVLSGAWC